jgi:hypothetical protein
MVGEGHPLPSENPKFRGHGSYANRPPQAADLSRGWPKMDWLSRGERSLSAFSDMHFPIVTSGDSVPLHYNRLTESG